MAQRPLDLHKVNQIYDLFEGGAMISEIVTKVGTNRESVRKYLRQKYTPAQKRKIVKRNFKQLKGTSSPNWKGGKEITRVGYVRLWISKTERVMEHRLVMEQHLGRKLTKSEVVHHLNGDNADNRLENLRVTTFGEDIRLHNLERQSKAVS
ncbi:hypothetical protein A3A68_01035 [Candidatus Saccharibacteria bacterium RIFCSPLOWO2_01_FULL_48_13]|nr:MAG: hypothetical protein A3F38_02710 [Candidatus Saccharibacteria bacterium RIFCSPHIGHO2_12_FULL_48_21]OGL37024.1 MAG: hypothetical protein A3A68_01035 [Candidatus Saccharibacteria bacterium RIFCSPLOWO2_01_FULL_48_13]